MRVDSFHFLLERVEMNGFVEFRSIAQYVGENEDEDDGNIEYLVSKVSGVSQNV